MAIALLATTAIQAQDTLWVRYDNRFQANSRLLLDGVDSMQFRPSNIRIYSGKTFDTRQVNSFLPVDAASIMFTNPGRYLLKPNTYGSTDYTNANATSGYNFAHHIETDHYAIFWEVRYGSNPRYIKHPNNGSVANAYDVADICEKCWNKYVELGFVKPGQSTTDNYKIQLYIPYQSEWRADASGTAGVNGGLTGIGHFNPWAATSRGGVTVAHEVGHTFQFLVHADLGEQHGFDYGYGDNASGGNGWWESCANWQAFKVFPERQFSDGEYFGGYLNHCHMNLLSEQWRYDNCFIQDWWCDRHGTDFIGRIWRESNRPEDPVEAYKRLCNLTQEEFNDEEMLGCMHMATWDIEGIRDNARQRIGQHYNRLVQVAGTTDTWQSDSATCIENYGMNITNLTVPASNTEVKVDFKGIAGAAGFRSINLDKAGWRYALVAYNSNTRNTTYGEMGKTAEGSVSLTVPSGTTHLFLVVMGAPTEHWRHAWDDNTSNDEQWPYQVKITGAKVSQ